MDSTPEPPSLFLLPPLLPPAPHTLSSFRDPLALAITRLRDSTCQVRLVIALLIAVHPCPSWEDVQSMIAGAYALVTAVCAERDIPTEVDGGAGSVDASVVLLRDDDDEKEEEGNADSRSPAAIPTLARFASGGAIWGTVFHLESREGVAVIESWQRLSEQGQYPPPSSVTALAAQSRDQGQDRDQAKNLAQEQAPNSNSPPDGRPCSQYPTVCLGGTFDHLHPGHKLLLSAAALLLKAPRPAGSGEPCVFVIGITGDSLLANKKFASHVQPWTERARSVLAFLRTFLDFDGPATAALVPSERKRDEGRRPPDGNPLREMDGWFCSDTVRVSCVEIRDAFGPTVTQRDMHALVVSRETEKGGVAVNDKRRELGWPEMAIFVVDVLHAGGLIGGADEGWEGKVSSTAIRERRAQAGDL